MHAHTHISVAILAQAEHLLQILCTPMASDMVTCKLCKDGTPTVWDGRKRPKLPPFWKWVWCYTPDGWKDCCTCKLCRFEIWRDCTKLEPYLSIEDFYAAVDKRLKATFQPTTQSQNSSDDVDVVMGFEHL